MSNGWFRLKTASPPNFDLVGDPHAGPMIKVNVGLAPCPQIPPATTINFTRIGEPYVNIDAEVLRSEIIKPKLPGFFQVDKDAMITLQLVPDRTAKNYHVDDLARAMHEIYRDPLTCMSIKDKMLTYKPADCFSFDIVLTATTVQFYLTVPGKWQDYARTKIAALWPRATVLQNGENLCQERNEKYSNVIAARLKTKQHDFYSLHTAKNDLRPLTGLLEAAKDLRGEEHIRVQIISRPSDRQQWEHDATQAYMQHRQGKPLKRRELTVGNAIQYVAETTDSICNEIYSFATEFLCMEPDKKPDQNILFSKEFAALALKNKQGLTEATIRKIREPVFDTEIRIITHAADQQRAYLLTKGIGGAFNELASNDNEFVLDPVRQRFMPGLIQDTTTFKMSLLPGNACTLSASELGKLMQLPGAESQQDYPIIEQIDTRESDLPATLLDPSGIWFGTIRRNGKDYNVFLPTKELDDLCHVYTITGGKGQGKSSLIERICYEANKKNWPAIALDPGKGLIGDHLTAALGKDKVIRYKFGIDVIGLDYREVFHGADAESARDRMADSLIGFLEVVNDQDTGIQTERYLNSAAKTSPSGRVADVYKFLTDGSYRKRTILNAGLDIDTVRLWTDFESFSDARQNQVLQPILNRLHIIMGNSFLKKCMDCQDGIDFVELIDNNPGKVIVLDIGINNLTRTQINIIGSLLMTKIDLAMALRKTQDDYPFFLCCDEPHQYLRSSLTWEHMSTEARKFRMAPMFFFHGWDQLPVKLQHILKDSGPHYILYNSAKHTYEALLDEVAPFTKQEGMATKKFHAICALKFCDNTLSPFMAKMAPPP